jgi:hypothetical protein
MTKGFSDYYAHGENNVICDRCGNKYKASQLRKEWDNFMVCSECWEPRQPQDFVRGRADQQVPPYSRPEQEDDYTFVCTLWSVQGRADYGTADCAQADINTNQLPQCTLDGSRAVAGLAVAGCMVAGRS